MVNREELSKVALTVICTFGLLLAAYNVVESVRYNGFFYPNRKRRESEVKDKLLHALQQLDKQGLDTDKLVYALGILLEFSAFTEAQVKINQLGYLLKITELLDHPNNSVKQKTALLINNLALNDANQVILRDYIPKLVYILSTNEVYLSSIELFTAVLCAVTNLTTLDESHPCLMPHINVLYDILRDSDIVQIRLQVLKILVNISTNRKMCENDFTLDEQLLRCMEPFIKSSFDEAFLLRAVSCYANVLEALQRRWRSTTIATPEFVPEKIQEQLYFLTNHEHEDIHFQANRCLNALKTPNNVSSPVPEELDILDVLKI